MVKMGCKYKKIRKKKDANTRRFEKKRMQIQEDSKKKDENTRRFEKKSIIMECI